MTTLLNSIPLSSMFMLLEARDDFLVQTFGEKLVAKVTDENQRGMIIPDDLKAVLKVVDETPPANKIVAWFSGNDPIQGKGVQWMIVQYIRGNYQLEDIDQVKHAMTEFVRVRTQLDVKDLGQYKTVDALNRALEPFQDKKVVSNRQARKSTEMDPTIKEQTTIYIDTDELLLVTPNTHASAKYFASMEFMGALTEYRATNWCTGREDPHYFDMYSRQGPLFFMLIKSGPDMGKYQFHFETKQFHTSANIRIPNLRGWLARNEAIRQFFEEKAAQFGILEFLSPEIARAYRQRYIDNGQILQLLHTDKVEVMYIPTGSNALHNFMMGSESYGSTWAGKSRKVYSQYGSGVMYIELANHAMYTYMLGYGVALYQDKKPYPIKNLTAKLPELKELLSGLMREAGVDTNDQTPPEVQELITSGAAKQIFSSNDLTVWWMSNAETFKKYFNGTDVAMGKLYGTPALLPEAGIMIMDVGTVLASYRLGDTSAFELNTDDISDRNNRHPSNAAIPINKFIVEHPATAPIIKKYADHYGYYPLMSDKGRAKKVVELQENGTVRVRQENSPSVIQLLTADSIGMIRPLLSLSYVADQSKGQTLINSVKSELERGPMFLVQGNILLSLAAGIAYQINSNNGLATVSTAHVFNRFPALKTLLKDELTAYGVSTTEAPPLAETISAMAARGTVIPISPRPLVLGLTTPEAVRWFVEHHTPMNKRVGNGTVQWGSKGIITPYGKVLAPIGPGDTTVIANGAVAYGFLGKGDAPQVLAVKPSGHGNSNLAVYAKFTDQPMAAKGDITTTQGAIAYMQKYPDVLQALQPSLQDDASDNVRELTSTIAGADADPYTKTTSAITGIMKSLKSTGAGVAEAQALSDYNFDKFSKNCYTAAAYLKAHGAEFTPAQVASLADRIINVMNYTSKESLRTMPKELAEWLKYATDLDANEKARIVRKHPIFIAGYDQAPIDLVASIYQHQSDDDIEVMRAYANLSDDDARHLDIEIFGRDSKPIGVDYNNVVNLVSAYRERYGIRTLGQEKLIYMRNVPAALAMEWVRATASMRRYGGGQDTASKIREFKFPTDDLARSVFGSNPGLATSKNKGIKFSRKTPMMRAMTKHIRQHGNLNDFRYTAPPAAQLPTVGGRRVARPVDQAPRANAPARAPVDRPAVPADGRFANKAAHARHIIDNRTPEDTRQTLIRQLIDVVGLTPAGASTYYYNLTRGPVREGDEDMGLLRSTLLSLLMG